MPWWSPHFWTTANQSYSDLFWAVSVAVAWTTRCSHCPKKLWAGTEDKRGMFCAEEAGLCVAVLMLPS